MEDINNKVLSASAAAAGARGRLHSEDDDEVGEDELEEEDVEEEMEPQVRSHSCTSFALDQHGLPRSSTVQHGQPNMD